MSRRFNINQLPTGSYAITGSFSGSFIGDGSSLQGITATAEPAGPTTAVQFNDGLNVSGSSQFTFDKTTGLVTVTSASISGLFYPNADGTDRQVIKTDGAGNLFFGYPESITIRVKNVDTITLQKGYPVHNTSSGTSGNIVGVVAADAGIPALMPAAAILNETLAPEAEGEALLSGFIQGVNTAGFTSGDVVYVAVGGGYTQTKPTGSALIQNLGIIGKVDPTNGSGIVYGSGRANDIPNLTEGYVWVGNNNQVATALATSSIQQVVSSSYAVTASFALNGGGGSTDTGSLLTTASVSLNTITFTKGDGTTFPILVDTGSNTIIPDGTVSSSIQISELGFVTSSATASFVLNSQTSSMSVATASYVAASNIDGTVLNAVSSSYVLRSEATNTIDITQGSVNTNRYVTFTDAINSDGALLADPGILYNPFSNTLTVANITGTASLASTAELVEYSNVNNKPTLVSGSAQISYTGITDVPVGIISSSAQIATDISGAFTADSASFSTRITGNENNINTLINATSSYILASQTSSMSVATASYVQTAETASFLIAPGNDEQIIYNNNGILAGSNKLTFDGNDLDVDGIVYFRNVFNNEVDLPAVATHHGMFAHVHGTGLAYYAHVGAGGWNKLASYDRTNSDNLDIIADATMNAGTFTIAGAGNYLQVSNLRLLSNTISAQDTDGNIILTPNGTGTVDVSSKKITNLATPTTSTDAATKGYVDTATNLTASVVSASAESTDATYYPIFGTSNGSAGMPIHTDGELNYNPSTNTLSATNFVGTGSALIGVVSSSYSVTASYADTAQTLLGTVESASYSDTAVTASYALTAETLIGSIETASFAFTASFLLGSIESASYADNALTASYALVAETLLGSIESASYASTASYVETAQTASYIDAGNITTGTLTNDRLPTNINVTNVTASFFTGSFVGDGSQLDGVINTPGGADTYVQINSGSTFLGTGSLVFDYTNQRLGINDSSPAYALEVSNPDPVDTDSVVTGINGKLLYSNLYTAAQSGSIPDPAVWHGMMLHYQPEGAYLVSHMSQWFRVATYANDGAPIDTYGGRTQNSAGTFAPIANVEIANGYLEVDNLKMDVNTISALDTNGTIILEPSGSGTVDVSSKRITSVATPTAGTDATNKTYADNLVSSLNSATGSYVLVSQTSSMSVLNAETSSYVNGANVDGNILGNANNITAYTINQNLGTTDQVTFGGITSSLVGTSSWSENSITASYADTASYINPLTQDVIITGSLTVSGSNIANYIQGRTVLHDRFGNITLDSDSTTLTRPTGGTPSIDWGTSLLYDTNASQSINYDARILSDNNNVAAINYSTTKRFLQDTTGATVLNFGTLGSATFDGTSSFATTSSYALTAQTLLGSVVSAETASYILGSGVDGTVSNATNATTATQVSNAVTFNNGGSGDASGTTFDGAAARTISYNTLGAPATDGTDATGTWGIDITGNAATSTSSTTAATASYVQASNIDGVIQPRVTSIASSATPTPNADTTDLYIITALAVGATFGAPTGTPVQGQKLTIRIEDNGGAQSLAYNAIYRAFGVALPTTTTAGKTLYLGCIYNSTDSAWDVVAVTEQV